MNAAELLEKIETTLGESAPSDQDLLQVLDHALEGFSCVVGTLHELDADSQLLKLRAQRGVPETILEPVSSIPIGKGMAGLAAERLEPVQVCNLQTDESGVARPAAKETKMLGSIAAPMLVDGELRGMLGVSKPEEYEFTAEEIATLMEIGGAIGRRFGTPR